MAINEKQRQALMELANKTAERFARQLEVADELQKQAGMTDLQAFIVAGDVLSRDKADVLLAEGVPYLECIAFVGSYARCQWALENATTPERYEQLLEIWPGLWRGADPDDTDERFVTVWNDCWTRHGRTTVLDGEPLPDGALLTVFRGQRPEDPRGLAWTTEVGVAAKFASTLGQRQRVEGGTVLTGTVDRRDVLAYLTGRNEWEVVVDPRLVSVTFE